MPGNNRGDALAIGLGETASISITSPGSHYYEVQLEEGTTYSIGVSLGTVEYSVVAIKNTEGATLKLNIIAVGGGTRIVWTATRSGSYFVDVTALRGPGSYSLTVTDVESPRSTPAAPQLIATPIPTATPLPSAPALVFESVSAGGQHSCGVTTNGAAYCWGSNGDSFPGNIGSLGNGSAEIYSQTTPVAVSGGLTFASVSTGWRHTCGVTTDGAAYCWGGGTQGKLGNGSTESHATPVTVSGGLTFASVNPGRVHTCGVTTSGAAYCWGENGGSHLGNNTSTTQRLPPEATRIPVPVLGGLTFASVSAGSDYTCGVTTGGGAYCWEPGALAGWATVRMTVCGRRSQSRAG